MALATFTFWVHGWKSIMILIIVLGTKEIVDLISSAICFLFSRWKDLKRILPSLLLSANIILATNLHWLGSIFSSRLSDPMLQLELVFSLSNLMFLLLEFSRKRQSSIYNTLAAILSIYGITFSSMIPAKLCSLLSILDLLQTRPEVKTKKD
jgi:hypothetical protein